jgi:hypothetical protein
MGTALLGPQLFQNAPIMATHRSVDGENEVGAARKRQLLASCQGGLWYKQLIRTLPPADQRGLDNTDITGCRVLAGDRSFVYVISQVIACVRASRCRGGGAGDIMYLLGQVKIVPILIVSAGWLRGKTSIRVPGGIK